MKMILLSLLLASSVAGAHSRLKPSTGINTRSTDPGVKTGPCGGYAKVAPAVLTSGQTLTVTWEETIHHPGRFEFYYSNAGEANFQLLKTIENTQNDNNVPHQYSTTVTLPNVTCDSCTFQMIQVMTENPAAPTNYYSCADMQLKAAGTATPVPTATPVACP
jgi:hypothetical protein